MGCRGPGGLEGGMGGKMRSGVQVGCEGRMGPGWGGSKGKGLGCGDPGGAGEFGGTGWGARFEGGAGVRTWGVGVQGRSPLASKRAAEGGPCC